MLPVQLSVMLLAHSSQLTRSLAQTSSCLAHSAAGCSAGVSGVASSAQHQTSVGAAAAAAVYGVTASDRRQRAVVRGERGWVCIVCKAHAAAASHGPAACQKTQHHFSKRPIYGSVMEAERQLLLSCCAPARAPALPARCRATAGHTPPASVTCCCCGNCGRLRG
jgi:hypothetical protein